jgi:hypothetical protein
MYLMLLFKNLTLRYVWGGVSLRVLFISDMDFSEFLIDYHPARLFSNEPRGI